MRASVPAVLLLVLAVLLVSPARGGGPLYVNPSLMPPVIAWDPAQPVGYHPESGGLGTLSNGQARALVDRSFQVWEDVASAAVTFS
jgi:hypothetical protein